MHTSLSSKAVRDNRHELIIKAIKLGYKLLFSSLLLSLLVLIGYVFNVDFFYRHFSLDLAVHRLTLICTLLTSTSFILIAYHKNKLVQLISTSVFILTAIRLFDYLLGPQFIFNNLPYYIADIFNLIFDMHEEKNIMGLNTTIMFLLLSLSSLMRTLNKPNASQIFGFLSLSIPTISITGYVFNLSEFYGSMSPVTTVYGLIISIGVLCISAHKGAIKAMLLPTFGGRLARYLSIIGYSYCFGLGYLAIKSIDEFGNTSLFGAYVVAMCWFIILILAVSALTYEKEDKSRRFMEKYLLQLSREDPLTALYNRRGFYEEIGKEIKRRKRKESNACFIIIDIDSFKKINDQFGHGVGDEILKLIANIIKNNLRSTDIICRLGGEEFAVMLPDTDIQECCEISERIRAKVRGTNVKSKIRFNSPEFVSISIGCSLLPSSSSNVNETLEKADKALYEAKIKGRNRVCIYDDSLKKKSGPI
ncbi:GGDEF domain-containing protein [Photobacterium sp. SP02]|uniref:GGDEF domain-containing protein n=1 Tax=Photobacterium sp. SP02 TaxID=3032280 RepID=UPI003144E257